MNYTLWINIKSVLYNRVLKGVVGATVMVICMNHAHDSVMHKVKINEQEGYFSWPWKVWRVGVCQKSNSFVRKHFPI